MLVIAIDAHAESECWPELNGTAIGKQKVFK